MSASVIGNSHGKALTWSIAGLLLAGLSISPATTGSALAQTQPAPTSTQLLSPQLPPSNMNHALRCMDDLLAARSPRTITLTWAGLIDENGKVMMGSKEIMITALAKMSVKSNAFNFVDHNNGNTANQAGFPGHLFHSSRRADQPADSIEYRVISAYRAEQSVASIKTRMYVEEIATGNPIWTTVSSNSLHIPTSSAQNQEQQNSPRLAIELNRNSPKPTRAMIELSLIETLGKLTGVPFRQCLD